LTILIPMELSWAYFLVQWLTKRKLQAHSPIPDPQEDSMALESKKSNAREAPSSLGTWLPDVSEAAFPFFLRRCWRWDPTAWSSIHDLVMWKDESPGQLPRSTGESPPGDDPHSCLVGLGISRFDQVISRLRAGAEGFSSTEMERIQSAFQRFKDQSRPARLPQFFS
jgi:hypothetical protein